MSKSKQVKSQTTVSVETTNDLATVQEHYQDYPYPYRDPEEETKRLLAVSGEFLGELNHYLYRGKKDFNSGFRVLIAGGGTGDSTIYMAEQLKNKNAEVVYLDFSKPSMEIAQKRAEKRGLTNIKWVYDSILNIPKLNLGKFDYINCTGVLHHLKSPPDGLKILKDSLTDHGAMGVMVYAKYGRTGLYQVQDIMKMVNQGVSNRVEEIMNAKAVMAGFPATNWYIRGQELLRDHVVFGDIGLYDLFLHKQDRAYSIPELYEFIHNAGLNFVEFSDVSEKLALRIENYISDFSLLQKIKRMDIITQQAICELIVGNIIKHSFFASNAKDTIATLDNLDNVPYFYGIAGIAKQIYDHMEASTLIAGNVINFTLNTSWLKNINIAIPVSNYTKYVFKQMIDGGKSLQEIFDLIREELQQEISNEALLSEVKTIFAPFFTTGIMLLHDKSVKLF
ncbi:class I SAM-dependent methyltransferase [Candidatus Tisiphia endosymbiont of Xenochironomus xenolabis]|uniref:class I SAM-dependent methyltransferase n=1 Tax=Candidatus Tisiphia endosymbiont of Xenochironomus xenolabis TaxID=3139334 RepID=UPI0035C8F239